MKKSSVQVLFIGKSEAGLSLLFQWLRDHGCECRFALSYAEGLQLFTEASFDLVLCSGLPGIRTLFPAIIGSPASLFCAHPIEDSCLWVPVVFRGDECLGKSALSPKEFAEILRKMLNEIKATRDSSTAATG